MLPLPTTDILCWRFDAQRATAQKGCMPSWSESAAPVFGSRRQIADRCLHQRKVKNSRAARTIGFAGVLSPDQWRHRMRPQLRYRSRLAIDRAFIGGFGRSDLPGIGTFTYNGSPSLPRHRGGRRGQLRPLNDPVIRSVTDNVKTLIGLRLDRIGLKSMVFPAIVSSGCGDETILPCDETISCFGADIRKRRDGYQSGNKTAEAPAAETRRPSNAEPSASFLPWLSCWLGPSMAGSSDSGLPGIGTFAYNGSPMAVSAPQPMVVAGR